MLALFFQTISKGFTVLMLAVGFGWLMKRSGKQEATLEQSENTAEVLAKQRDNAISNVDDANSMWKKVRGDD